MGNVKKRRVDQTLYSNIRGDVCNILAVSFLLRSTTRHEIWRRDKKAGVGAFQGIGGRCLGVHIGLTNSVRFGMGWLIYDMSIQKRRRHLLPPRLLPQAYMHRE